MTRTAVLSSLICALTLIYGCTYIVEFGMKHFPCITMGRCELLLMGPSRRHTRSAGISSGTGVQKWTRPVNSLPYPTLLFAQLAICFHHDHLHPRGAENENLDLVERLNIIGDARRMDVHGGCQNKRFFTLSQIKSIPCSLSICYWNWVGFRPSPTWSLGD